MFFMIDHISEKIISLLPQQTDFPVVLFLLMCMRKRIWRDRIGEVHPAWTDTSYPLTWVNKDGEYRSGYLSDIFYSVLIFDLVAVITA